MSTYIGSQGTTAEFQAGEGGDPSLNQLGQSSPDAAIGGEQGDKTPSNVRRGEPQISASRKALVQKWTSEIRQDKSHWKDTFDRMRSDQDFAYGKQWSDSRWDDDRYTVNITLRHIQQRVASLYARNPTVVAKRKERLMNTVWDGTASGVMMAMQQLQQIQMNPEVGMVDPSLAMGPMQTLQEAQKSVEYKSQMDRFAQTLELLYEYNLDEQVHPFKSMMKMMVRRACTTSVGYVKLGFQRVLQPRPETEAQIADATQKLATLERLSADMADSKMEDGTNAAEAEQLRLLIQSLQSQPEMVVREGIVLDYPESHSIIPDRKVRQLRNFLGADYVTQEYVLSPEEVEEIYQIDIGTHYKAYRVGTTNDPTVSPVQDVYEPGTNKWSFDMDETDREKRKNDVCLVWEVYNRLDGMVYILCDGYIDFLREPAPPEVWMERFYPWFPLVLNEVDHPTKVYPPSDVELVKDQQKEYNRLREGLREHRIANRPALVASAGSLSGEDLDKMVSRPANAVLELSGLQPGQSVDQLLQGLSLPGVDPNLYEVNGIFEDVLRAVGVQEANLGGAGGSTATETSIAESARMSSLASNVDDLDDLLSQLARAAGQVLLAEVSEETVKEVVGPGAMWPQLSRAEMAKELFLDIEAGSTGRPNQAQEIQNFERLAPLLMQIPGISPELLAKEGIRRLDDRLTLEDLYDPNMMSISAMNQVAGSAPTQGAATANDPNAQGAEGQNNAEQPDAPSGASSEGSQPPPPVQ